DATPSFITPHAYLELHIEQGPVLEDEGLVIGEVEGITGLAWTEVTSTGRASHAGTTPMHLRRDAACAASEVVLFVRRLAQEMGGHQKGTGGRPPPSGTAPMPLRRAAACAASEVVLFVRRLAQEMGGHQKGTVGRLALYPNLINVVAERATLTVDRGNTEGDPLRR